MDQSWRHDDIWEHAPARRTGSGPAREEWALQHGERGGPATEATPPPQARSGQRQPGGGRLVFPLSRADETLSRAVAGKQAGAHRWEPRTAPESRLACLSAHPGQGCKGQGPPGVDRHADLRSTSSTASPPHTQAVPRCIAGGSQEETAHALRRLDLGVHSADSRARGPAASDAPGR